MSLFQQLFSLLLAPGTAPVWYPGSSCNGSQYSELRSTHLTSRLPLGHIAGTSFFLTSLGHSRAARPTPSTNTSKSSSLEHVERIYGTALIIAQCLGLRARLGLISRPAIAYTRHTNDSVESVDPSDKTPVPAPLSVASSSCDNEPLLQPPLRRPHFAHATPPKVQWRAPALPTPSGLCKRSKGLPFARVDCLEELPAPPRLPSPCRLSPPPWLVPLGEELEERRVTWRNVPDDPVSGHYPHAGRPAPPHHGLNRWPGFAPVSPAATQPELLERRPVLSVARPGVDYSEKALPPPPGLPHPHWRASGLHAPPHSSPSLPEADRTGADDNASYQDLVPLDLFNNHAVAEDPSSSPNNWLAGAHWDGGPAPPAYKHSPTPATQLRDVIEPPPVPIWGPIVLSPRGQSSAAGLALLDTTVNTASNGRDTPSPISTSSISPTEPPPAPIYHPRELSASSIPVPDICMKSPSPPPSLMPYVPERTDPYNCDRTRYPDKVVHGGTRRAYHVLGTLGEGGFGRVFIAISDRVELAALKVVHKRRCYRMRGVKAALKFERDCMAKAAEMRLPFWMQLRAAWEDEHNLYYAMLLALRDLREHEIVHGDIKPDNFLIRPTGQVVLSDFGLAQTPSEKFADRRLFVKWDTPMAGATPGYIPEACLLVPDEDRRFSHKTDLYTLGIVFVELMAGLADPLYDVNVYPDGYPGESYEWFELEPYTRQRWLVEQAKKSGYAKVVRDVLPRDSDGWNLCDQMWGGTPIEDLIRHQYFAGLDFDEVYWGKVSHDYRPKFRGCHLDAPYRDLTFEAWHSHRETDRTYDRHAHFVPLRDENRTLHTRWILDLPSTVEQMEEGIVGFEWPTQPESHW
ncbi:hypothetical protein C8Q80DRAFT_1276420 [Daedaleopsis nitida]|nr:hypothetical protein C8Q80DRAFT_1276420 [Daedaleopsis nitida]